MEVSPRDLVVLPLHSLCYFRPFRSAIGWSSLPPGVREIGPRRGVCCHVPLTLFTLWNLGLQSYRMLSYHGPEYDLDFGVEKMPIQRVQAV